MTENDNSSIGGRNILITGGTTGIGRATARLLAGMGARLFICGRHAPELADALGDIGGDVVGITVDLSTKEEVHRLFEEVDRRFERLDIAVCNAALAADGIEETSADRVDYVVRTNLLGYLHTSQQALARMKRASAGHLVLVGSMSADGRDADESVYAATKAGIQGFAESLRKEVNEQGIHVTLIQPGAVGTDMQPDKASHPEQEREMKMLKGDDVAECIRFCLTRPTRCDIVSMDVRPHLQLI